MYKVFSIWHRISAIKVFAIIWLHKGYDFVNGEILEETEKLRKKSP